MWPPELLLALRSNFRIFTAWIKVPADRQKTTASVWPSARWTGKQRGICGLWVCVCRRLLTCDVETFASAEQDAGGEEQQANASSVVPMELLVQLLESQQVTAGDTWRSSGCQAGCNVCSWLVVLPLSAMFPPAVWDLNLLCFVSFHHHFPLFDFYLLIYFGGECFCCTGWCFLPRTYATQ